MTTTERPDMHPIAHPEAPEPVRYHAVLRKVSAGEYAATWCGRTVEALTDSGPYEMFPAGVEVCGICRDLKMLNREVFG